MNHTEITREETAEFLSKILTIQSEILANPTAETCSLYPSAEQAFNALSEALGYSGEPFPNIAFSDDFNRSFAKLFYGVGEKTLGLTHSFWTEGGLSTAGAGTGNAFAIYRKEGLGNATSLPDDHLAVELAFIAKLLSENKIKEAVDFTVKEVLSWWPNALLGILRASSSEDLNKFFKSINSSLLMVSELAD